MRVLEGDPRRWGPASPRGAALTIGVYDGVHRGHQAVLADLAERAGALGVDQTAVLTFDRHPLSLVAPDRVPRLLMTMEHRLGLLGALGVEVVGILPFDRVREMAPTNFIDQVLVGSLGARLVVVGTNFRFGRDRAGDVNLLRRAGARNGFEVDAVELLRGEGTAVSSSVVRGLLADGEVAAAQQALGRPFELRGVVVSGDGRGHSIGFPTANLDFAEDLAVPARGVYAVRVRTGGALIPGVANVGVRPTFGGERLTVEVHLIGFEGDLYGRTLAIQFERRLRDEKRFSGVPELVVQIGRDVEAAGTILDLSGDTRNGPHVSPDGR